QYKRLAADNQPYHTILALEEPEAHLHPQAQRTLYEQLSKMKGQKIISTHSPFIASQCQLNEIRHFKKAESHTEITALDIFNLNPEDQRKLRREVLNTRGELLFARFVVLFEGATEDQALPIFAEKYWQKHHYESGISFIGVGGDGNYTPFLRLLKSFEIDWYIFSDGEAKSIERVKNALQHVGIATNPIPGNIIIIPDNLNFESYLIQQGYQAEIKKAILEYKKDNGEIANENHLKAKEKEIETMTEQDLKKFMNDYKTKLSPYYSKIIVALNGDRCIPKIIRTLFEEMSKIIR
ncbi:AAA family ATPase, partial [candidate division KSB1 bacterium]|nr:AAA family ATPase [candidate division KSB1 bacterium]